MEKKQFSALAIFTVILALLVVFGIYHSIYRQTRPFVPSIIMNEEKRQDFIDGVWKYVGKHLEDKTKGYLDANDKLTTWGENFIKKTVKEKLQQLVGKEALATDEQLKTFEDLLVTSLLASYYFLEWCPCILPGQRVDLAFQMIQDIKKRFPDPTQKLVYVSLGSGDLLQDFIAIAALINQGYCNLDINAIDFKYKHIVHTTVAEDKKQNVPGIDTTGFAKKVAHVIDAFKTHITNLLAATKPHLRCSVDIEPFTSAYTYIESIQKGLEPKANIIVMVDPNRALYLFKVDNIKDANILEFSDNGLIVCMAEHQKPKAYIPIDSSKQYIASDLAKIRQIIRNTTQNNYRAQLKRELVNYIKEFNTQQAETKKRSLTYYGDPFITFQDIIRYAATPTALAYGLYELPGKHEADIVRIDVEKYKTEDVITGYAGRDLMRKKQYKPIDL